MDGGVGAAVANTRIVDDAGVDGGENADPFVAASSSYEACEVDGPAPPETLRVDFACVDESVNLRMGDVERVGCLVDTESGHKRTRE